jgi:hypothetical protein
MEGKTPREIDLAGTDGGMHARLAQGLIDAANYIREHPHLPVPFTVDIHYCIPASTDKAGEDEAYRIAAMLGTHVTGDDTSSEAHREFGPAVNYRAVYITRARAAGWQAHMATYLAERRAAISKAVSEDRARVYAGSKA